MDAIVEAALKKWPNVPHCYGWLALDARGDWYMRDDRVQAAGPFPAVKGSRIEHAKLVDFITRNYDADARGAWFFQNGPQRVYVELEAAPWVWRLHREEDGRTGLRSHTGREAEAGDVFVDEHGRLFAESSIGLGIVHTQDMDAAATAVEAGEWRPTETTLDALAARNGVMLKPVAPPSAPPPA